MTKGFRRFLSVVMAGLLLCGLMPMLVVPASAADYSIQFPLSTDRQWYASTYLGHGGDGAQRAAVDLNWGSGEDDAGLPVYAVADGIVKDSGTAGRIVILHENPLQTTNGRTVSKYWSVYAHMTDVTVKEGDWVNKGKQIGRVGNVGTTDSHLHFALAAANDTSNKMEWYDGDASLAISPYYVYGFVNESCKSTTWVELDLQGPAVESKLKVAPTCGVPTVTPTIKSDTVLVLDYSASMSGAPMTALKEAAIVFCEGVAAASGTNRVAIVIYDSTIRFQNFTQDLDEMRTYINNTRGGGNTNIAGALKKAGELMSASSAGVKNVLLMTDGMPNAGNYETTGKYTSADHSSYRYANAAYTAAVELWNAQCNVYTLGFFHSLNATDTAFGRRFLTDMQSDGYWEVINIEDIEDAFKEILKEMQLDPEKWWELLPGWLQLILRYIFFGWLWMNWF